ncbi:hypothetical protein ACH5RR_025530 [Cinchona calisaya]|uniref:Uncharacterized protein n=1 Tax=Cinchona calisaya TaxID=153742 RepID=A0ABD2Z108_9GENT
MYHLAMDKDNFRDREHDGGLGSREGDGLWVKLWQLRIPLKNAIPTPTTLANRGYKVSLPTHSHSFNKGMMKRIQRVPNYEIAEMIATRREVEFGVEINILDETRERRGIFVES